MEKRGLNVSVNNQIQTLKIHYYFNDDSHSMNAFVRNKAEKDLLDAVRQIGNILDNDLSIETTAYQEGGLIEILAIGIPVLHYLSPAINNIVTHYFTKNTKQEKLDIEIKEVTLQGLKLDNEKKVLEIEEIINKKLEDKLTIRHVSNYYKKIDNYKKVKSIGFKVEGNEREYIVERKYFKDFILEDNTTITEDDEAFIEIISPVLKEGKYKWRGRYLGEKIEFSMGDYGYKTDVIKGKYTFSNGSLIECKLQITITYDEFGDEKRKSYSVREVYGTSEDGNVRMREAGIKRNHNKWFAKHDGGSLFDEDE